MRVAIVLQGRGRRVKKFFSIRVLQERPNCYRLPPHDIKEIERKIKNKTFFCEYHKTHEGSYTKMTKNVEKPVKIQGCIESKGIGGGEVCGCVLCMQHTIIFVYFLIKKEEKVRTFAYKKKREVEKCKRLTTMLHKFIIQAKK